jgi:hypothetical protein
LSLLSGLLGTRRATAAKRVGVFMAACILAGAGLALAGWVAHSWPLLWAGVAVIVLGLLPLFLVGGLVNVLVLGMVRSVSRQKAAARFGLSYARHDPFAIDRIGFAGLGDGAAEHVSWGAMNGRQVVWFEWSRGLVGREGSYACAMVDVGAGCPPLIVTRDRVPEGLLPEVETEAVEFNRAFRVLCPDRRFATAFCDARLMAWLLDAFPQDVTIEARGRFVLCRTMQRRHLPGVGWTMAFISAAMGRGDDDFDRVLTALGALAPRLPGLLPSMWPPTSPALHVTM